MKRRHRVALGCATPVLIIILVFLVATAVTKHRLDSILANLDEPEALRMHRRLVEDRAGSDESLAPFREKLASFKDVSGAFPWSFEWDDLMKEHGSPERRGEDYWEAWERYVTEHAAYLERVRVCAAVDGPLAVIDLAKGLGNVENFHIHKVSEMTALLARDAEVATRQGEVPRAADDVVAMLQLADALAYDPTLQAQSVRFSTTRDALELIQHVLPVELPRDRTRRLIDVMGGMDRREELSAAYAGEIQLSRIYIREPQRIWGSPTTWKAYFREPLLVLYTTPVGAPAFNLDAITYFDTISRLEALVRLPYRQAREQLAAIDAELSNLPMLRIMSRLYLYRFTGWIWSQATHEASLDLAQIGLAVEQHYAQTGTYPATLDAIAGNLPEDLPTDPFSGQPYIYVPAADGFLLYSVGRNQIDDGGVASIYAGNSDIAWRAPENAR